jgi:UDP-N-acetylglucosamine 2-epimerase
VRLIKVLSIFGTCPEAIKPAPVIRELRRHPDQVVCKVCVTAQYRQMRFRKPRAGNLNAMEDNQSPTQVASAVLARLEPILQAKRPDWVLVQRDRLAREAI